MDSHSGTEILEILKRLNEDFHKTVVMVTTIPTPLFTRRSPVTWKRACYSRHHRNAGAARALIPASIELQIAPAIEFAAGLTVADSGNGSAIHFHALRPLLRTTACASP